MPGGYVLRPHEFEWLPGARTALRQAGTAGWVCAVVTNQACIGRGLATAAEIRDIHERMVAQAREDGAAIERVFTCPHRPEDGCPCRKPKPGLFLAAARELNVNLRASWFIGDAETDLEAARAAGVRFVLVRTGMGASTSALHPDVHAAEDVLQAVRHVLSSAT